ncbi:spindle and kinetochore-associated protein 3 [Perognathus longimembris pacificus]|uniref:spindle and kinetochore-associated protein 3 n=1 Tax=Perognathus longimembris pacificus TaxID=214514 RepID=UPI0020199664|nr:spindle and kinetochore-associated protein 3 [Perognathus longimembris pacificus]
MDPIRSFCGKLRTLASTLDDETSRLQRALIGEENDLEDYPMRILHDLHSEVQNLKDDVNTLLNKARLQSQESIGFIKAAKVLMKKNSTDIIKIREFFEKYGYDPRVKENSVCEKEVTDPPLELAETKHLPTPDRKAELSDPLVSENLLRSPQLSDFGLERYMIPQVLLKPQQAVDNHMKEHTIDTPPTTYPLVKVPTTPKCTLNMDNFECVTPKLEHFGISEYSMCLNEDYTRGLKKMMTSKSEEAIRTEPVTDDNFLATPGSIIQQREKCGAEYTDSPLVPTFRTPGLKIPSTKNTTLVSTNSPLSKTNNLSNDLEVKDCASIILSSDECFENFADPSSPKISSYENLLRTPTPPEVTAVPEDILQILSKYKSNLTTPVAVKAVPPRKGFLRYEGQSIRDVGNKENW